MNFRCSSFLSAYIRLSCSSSTVTIQSYLRTGSDPMPSYFSVSLPTSTSSLIRSRSRLPSSRQRQKMMAEMAVAMVMDTRNFHNVVVRWVGNSRMSLMQFVMLGSCKKHVPTSVLLLRANVFFLGAFWSAAELLGGF